MDLYKLKQQFSPNKRLFLIFSTVVFILLIPLIAMQFTAEVNWNIADFLIAGFLLLSAGLIAELIIRKINTPKSRTLFIICLIVGLLLVWAELAVGIFGTPFAGS